MAKNQKCFIHGSLIEVTFRAEAGLPLPATPYLRCLLESIFARAQSLYFVRIVGITVMSNHIHMILIVDCPSHVTEFIRYVKAETAHAINRLLGREKHTVWCEGYDSPIILDAQKAIERLVYLYTNPQRADLVERIDQYPNFNTWEALLNGEDMISVNRIPRKCIPPLPKGTLSLEEQNQITNFLEYSGKEVCLLHIEPDAWMECFAEIKPEDKEGLRSLVIDQVRETERAISEKRVGAVIGAHALRLQSMRAKHEPKKFGRKMICLASSRERRAQFIQWFKERQEAAREATRYWLSFGILKSLPPGFFLPGGALIANVLPITEWLST